MAKPDFLHPTYEKFLPKWKLVDDICDAENLQDHLIKRNPDDKSVQNTTRNTQIFKRATFYAVAGYTARGFVGMIFGKPPVTNIPPDLEYVLEDVDGAGNSIDQQAQDVAKNVIRKGRCGLLVDFPKTQGEVTQADMTSGQIFAPIIKYESQEIINWRVDKVGAKQMLTLVVIKTQEKMLGEDGFEFEYVDVIHEMRLAPSSTGQMVYMTQEWRKDHLLPQEWIPSGYETVYDASGQPWDIIPFCFVGAEANTPSVDQPPMYDIAKINAGHYNNSAIYEDSVFVVGQAQPWMSGISQDHIDLLNKNNMYVGSGQLLGVPSQEQFGIAQVQPNTMAKEAMEDKVKMMVGLGAMFIQPGSAVKTAEQAKGEKVVQHSVLSLIAENVSQAYVKCLEWAGRFMGTTAPQDGYQYELSKDFVDETADPQTLQQIVAGFMQGAIPISDYLDWLQRHNLVDEQKTLEEFSAEVGREEMPDLDAE